MIQILPEIDEIDKNINCLSIDDKINQDYNNLRGLSAYVLQYPEREKASVSYGIILKNVDKRYDNEYEFKHICSTNKGSSGSPILDLETNKVIGIHYMAYKKEIEEKIVNGKIIETKEIENDFNGGIFLKEPLLEFHNNCNCYTTNNPSPISNIIPKNYCDFGCNTEKEYKGLYGLSNLFLLHSFLNKLKSIKKKSSNPIFNQNSNPNSNPKNNSNQNSNQNLTKNLTSASIAPSTLLNDKKKRIIQPNNINNTKKVLPKVKVKKKYIKDIYLNINFNQNQK